MPVTMKSIAAKMSSLRYSNDPTGARNAKTGTLVICHSEESYCANCMRMHNTYVTSMVQDFTVLLSLLVMKLIDTKTLLELSTEAATSTRLRRNLNLHPQLDDPVQRFCNAMEPGTYVRPHRHSQVDKWELFLALSGSVAVLTFDDVGKVIDRIELSANGPVFGIEIAEYTWHTLVSLEPGTVLFELKRGPYQPLTDKDFAQWAINKGR